MIKLVGALVATEHQLFNKGECMMNFRMEVSQFCDIRDILTFITETVEETSIQGRKAEELLLIISKFTKEQSHKQRKEILREDVLRSDLIADRVRDIGHLL